MASVDGSGIDRPAIFRPRNGLAPLFVNSSDPALRRLVRRAIRETAAEYTARQTSATAYLSRVPSPGELFKKVYNAIKKGAGPAWRIVSFAKAAKCSFDAGFNVGQVIRGDKKAQKAMTDTVFGCIGFP